MWKGKLTVYRLYKNKESKDYTKAKRTKKANKKYEDESYIDYTKLKKRKQRIEKKHK